MNRKASIFTSLVGALSISAAWGESQVAPGFVAHGVPQVVQSGPVKAGDILVAVPMRYAETGVLQGDLIVSAVVTGRLVMRSGTPVVRWPMSQWNSPIKKFAWCGPAESPATDEVGWCMLEGKKQFDQLWKVTSGSGYLPGDIQRLMMFKDPRPTVESKEVVIPAEPREKVWRFVASKKDRVEVAVLTRIVGKDHAGKDIVRLKRDKGGIAKLAILDGELRFLPGADESVAIVEVAKPIGGAE